MTVTSARPHWEPKVENPSSESISPPQYFWIWTFTSWLLGFPPPLLKWRRLWLSYVTQLYGSSVRDTKCDWQGHTISVEWVSWGIVPEYLKHCTASLPPLILDVELICVGPQPHIYISLNPEPLTNNCNLYQWCCCTAVCVWLWNHNFCTFSLLSMSCRTGLYIWYTTFYTYKSPTDYNS